MHIQVTHVASSPSGSRSIAGLANEGTFAEIVV